MEAKDTVMTKHQAEEALNPTLRLVKRFFGTDEKVTGRDAILCCRQAEISFKAGYEEGKEYAFSEVLSDYNDAKKAGKREVARYIKKNWSCRYPVGSSGYEEWQAKLKSWGINE